MDNHTREGGALVNHMKQITSRKKTEKSSSLLLFVQMNAKKKEKEKEIGPSHHPLSTSPIPLGTWNLEWLAGWSDRTIIH